jgi:hypothetical protein
LWTTKNMFSRGPSVLPAPYLKPSQLCSNGGACLSNGVLGPFLSNLVPSLMAQG